MYKAEWGSYVEKYITLSPPPKLIFIILDGFPEKHYTYDNPSFLFKYLDSLLLVSIASLSWNIGDFSKFPEVITQF